MNTTYSIFSTTNRSSNKSQFFADACKNILNKRSLSSKIFSLQDIPESFKLHHIYEYDESPLHEIVEKYIVPSDKFIFIIPEYNGSFPGILKVFIDAIHPKYFVGKKALLIGTSSGRAGNLRGMDHLTTILHYLKVEVYSQKLPISSIGQLTDDHGVLTDKSTIASMEDLLTEFQQF